MISANIYHYVYATESDIKSYVFHLCSTSGVVERKDNGNYVKACTRSMVVGTALVGRPRKTWQNTVSADMHMLNAQYVFLI